MLAYQPESQRAQARTSGPPSRWTSAPGTGAGTKYSEEKTAIAEQIVATVAAAISAARARGIATVHRIRFASSAAPGCAPGPFRLGTSGMLGSSFKAAAYDKARRGTQNPPPVTARNMSGTPGARGATPR